MRTNAHLYIRHDAWRFMPPGSPRYIGKDVVKYFGPAQVASDRRLRDGANAAAIALEIRELQDLKCELAAVRTDISFRRFMRALKAYNPNQPRVPAGNSDGGQWTNEGGGGSRPRLAAADQPNLGRHAIVAIAVEMARRAIASYRSENGLWDLFKRKDGAVTFTTFNGEQIFGSNSDSPTYRSIDRTEADRLRDLTGKKIRR
jgi:hypothetical protein